MCNQFTQKTDKVVQCNLCKIQLAFAGGTGCMNNHMKAKHPSVILNADDFGNDCLYSQTHLISHRSLSQSAYCHRKIFPRPALIEINVRWLCPVIVTGALNLQDLKMSDHKKTMTGNCNTWKMMDQIAALEFARPGKDQIAGAGKCRTWKMTDFT